MTPEHDDPFVGEPCLGDHSQDGDISCDGTYRWAQITPSHHREHVVSYRGVMGPVCDVCGNCLIDRTLAKAMDAAGELELAEGHVCDEACLAWAQRLWEADVQRFERWLECPMPPNDDPPFTRVDCPECAPRKPYLHGCYDGKVELHEGRVVVRARCPWCAHPDIEAPFQRLRKRDS